MSGRRRRGRLPKDVAGTVILDAGAVTKIASGDAVARSIWRMLTQMGWCTAVPAVTLAEVATGKPHRDAPINLLIRQVGGTIPCDEQTARGAGALRFTASRSHRMPSAVDAIVAATAQDREASIVLTTDPADLTALLARTERATVVGV